MNSTAQGKDLLQHSITLDCTRPSGDGMGRRCLRQNEALSRPDGSLGRGVCGDYRKRMGEYSKLTNGYQGLWEARLQGSEGNMFPRGV